jgi:aspartate racemase
LRKLGIIGGTSWSSTALYYQHINRGIAGGSAASTAPAW